MEPDEALLTLPDDVIGYAPLTPPESPRGRRQLPPGVVRRIQRERILHGTASAVSEKGYERTSVADIVGAAGVSRDVFYTHLHSRDDALEQAARFFFEKSLATTAGAFFTASESWPEQLWAAARELSELLAVAPAFTKFAFVDASAPDRAAARRTDDLFLGFAMFVERGIRRPRPGTAVVELAPAAIVAGLVEAVVHFIVAGRTAEVSGLLGLAAYTALAPVIGVREANSFVDRKLASLRPE
jgi:AcrR family transcriptional regulator